MSQQHNIDKKTDDREEKRERKRTLSSTE